MDWSDLARTLRPGPVRQNVRHRMIGAPIRLVQIEPVLLEARQIDDAEIRAARRIKRSWLAKVVKPGPHKFAANVRIAVLRRKLLVRRIGPRSEIKVIRADLANARIFSGAGRCRRSQSRRYRKRVETPAADRRFVFTADDELVRKVLVKLRVLGLAVAESGSLVVEPNCVDRRRELTGRAGIIHGADRGTRRILVVTNVRELCRDGGPLRAPLLSNFVADAPHYY